MREKLKPEIRQNIPIDIEAALTAIRESSETSSVYVGCDSVVLDEEIAYVTVLIIHYDSVHGGRIFKDIKFEYNHGNRNRRLLAEVGYAQQLASEVIEAVGARHFEIHLDINPDVKHASNAVMKEAVGWIAGVFGFKPKLKPHAFAASGASDHFAVAIRDNADRRRRNRKKRREWKKKQALKRATP